MKKVFVILLSVALLLSCLLGFAGSNQKVNGFEPAVLEGVSDIPDGFSGDILDGVNELKGD